MTWRGPEHTLSQPITLKALLIGVCLSFAVISSFAQTGAIKKKIPPTVAHKASAPQKPMEGAGWRVGKAPVWVVDPYLAKGEAPVLSMATPAGVVRRELLIDSQHNFALGKPLRKLCITPTEICLTK
jgi:hypothetical protein